LDELKVDQQFVRRSRESHNDLAIVRTIIELAQRLDLVCVAEGVETEEQAGRLYALGCDEAQGYLFGRPAPAWISTGTAKAGLMQDHLPSASSGTVGRSPVCGRSRQSRA